MMPTSRDRGDISEYLTATDADSFDTTSTSDDSWILSPARKKGEDSTPTPRGKHTARRTNEPSTTISLSSPPRSANSKRRHVKGTVGNSPDNVGSSSKSGIQRNQTHPVTPSKDRVPPAGTPTSRSFAIESAFKNLNVSASSVSAPPTPSRSRTTPQAAPKRRIVVVVSSDEEDEEQVSNVAPSQPPTRPSSFYDDPSTANSSQSSMNSLFSTVSAASSVSSVGSSTDKSDDNSPRRKLEEPRYLDRLTESPKPATVEPAVVRDVFNPEKLSSSPNVTWRKAQRREVKDVQSSPPAVVQVAAIPTIPESVSRFAKSPYAVDLDEAVIAHCDQTQRLLDESKIEWGTQYELARGISTGIWTWDDVREHIPKLKGKNAEAAFKVQRMMRGKESMQPSDFSLWKELDREQAAIKENEGRGLGLMGEWEGTPNWYGGRIQQIGRLAKNGQKYKIVLEHMEKRRSHRFARFYGSRRFLQVRIPDDLLRKENKAIKDFLKQKFILCGRVFVPFHSKDGSAYLVEIDENRGRTTQEWSGDRFRLSLNEFINWHNPLDEWKNCNQVISKYATRFALGLSNSVPALEFDEENIYFIDDITADDWPTEKKSAPADKLMTDGCGFINQAALLIITKSMSYESLPAGVQGRIDGGKGFWILHPTDTSNVPKIWIRDSQNKIKNRSFDRAHRIFDLLCPSRTSPSIALSQQSIINLFSNGVPDFTLIQMMEQGLVDDVLPLLKWNEPNAMLHLADEIEDCGNISGSRTQRLAASLNRALGLKGRDWHDSSGAASEEFGQHSDDAPTYTGRNTHSGAPLALHETAYELIQAGFHPAKNKLLQDKIGYIVQSLIDTTVEKYRISIDESLGAFIVPDPLGVLKEGEISYRFSKPRKDPRTEMLCHVLEGEVLLGRYPIRMPSDMQKVKAVDKRELDKWPDVIIVSTQGKRSIASLLADGDMDGDEVIVIWDSVLVEQFENKPFTSPPGDLMSRNFDRDVESVEQFCNRVESMSIRDASEAFQEVLIANLSEDQKGLYSMMHENATVMHGYGHPETVRLAYIFATLLDASKTGRRLKPGVFQQDIKRFGSSARQNSRSSHPDILAILKAAGDKKGEALREQYKTLSLEQRPKNFERSCDEDLKKPYEAANAFALRAYNLKIDAFSTELQRIRDHVKTAEELFREACYKSRSRKAQESPTKGKPSRVKADKEDLMLECTRKYAEPIEGIQLTTNLEQVKASYAYELSASFAFTVAFRELCHIKVLTSDHAPVLRSFDEAKKISSSYLRTLTRCEED